MTEYQTYRGPSQRRGLRIALAVAGVAFLGCGGSGAASRRTIRMEELRVTPGGVYDAESLFAEAFDLAKAKRCPEAVDRYDRVVREFPTSEFVSAALYNAGLCLMESGDANGGIARFERLLREHADSPDTKHGRFQLLALYLRVHRDADAISVADALLADKALDPDERMEAMSMRSEALLSLGSLDDAERQARIAVAFYREGSERDEVHGFSQAAQANFVLADVLRQRSEAIAIPPGTAEEQHQVLERRAQLLLKAQTEYFNTIRYTDPAWAARAGYQIGALYDRMWATISEAPVPPPRRKFGEADMRIYEDEYRKEMARMIRPLVRHAIRYWELTLMMIERASVDSEWSAKLKADLEAARTRLRLTAPDDGDDAAGEDARQEPHVPSRGSDALAKPPAPAATTP